MIWECRERRSRSPPVPLSIRMPCSNPILASAIALVHAGGATCPRALKRPPRHVRPLLQRRATRRSSSAAAAMPPAKPDAAATRARALDMLDFINASWTPYHAVEEASKRLAAAGFQHIAEKDAWELQPGGWGVAAAGWRCQQERALLHG
jgi:hypothetical protein